MDIIQLTIVSQNPLANTPNAADDLSIFALNDPYGGLMAMLGMGVVFLVLLLLYSVFSFTPRLYTFDFIAWFKGITSGKRSDLALTDANAPAEPKASDLSGEVNAAIAAAIHLYRSEMHDYENTVLTISKVSRTYSPWSSKIYGLRNTPR